MHEILLRVVVGGVVVSAFAILGDLLNPKSFAGLFGAAPSVALVTLALAVKQHGAAYASVEGRSMILGAVAFFMYASLVSRLMIRKKWAALPVTGLALLLWLVAALGLCYGPEGKEKGNGTIWESGREKRKECDASQEEGYASLWQKRGGRRGQE